MRCPRLVMTVAFGTPRIRLIMPSWLKRWVTSAPASITAKEQCRSFVKKALPLLLNSSISAETAATPHRAMKAGL